MIPRRLFLRGPRCEDDIASNSTDRHNNEVESPNEPEGVNEKSTSETALEELTVVERTAVESLKSLARHREEAKHWSGVLLVVCAFVCGCCFLSGVIQPRPLASYQLHQFLKQLDVDQYEHTLITHGYDRLEDVLWATEADLIVAGVVKHPHRVRILRKAESLRSPGRPWMMWMVMGMVCWSMMVGVMGIVMLIKHEDARCKCMTLIVWTAITLWARWRMYKRSWDELKQKQDMQDLLQSQNSISNPRNGLTIS